MATIHDPARSRFTFEPAGPFARVAVGTRIPIRVAGIPIAADRSLPRNTMEIRSGTRRVRVRWVDEQAEVDRWIDDGGRAP